jgi:hypothetical protein
MVSMECRFHAAEAALVRCYRLMEKMVATTVTGSQVLVQIAGGADQGQMGKRLREISQMLALQSGLF